MRDDSGVQAAGRLRQLARWSPTARSGWVPQPPTQPQSPTEPLDFLAILDGADRDGADRDGADRDGADRDGADLGVADLQAAGQSDGVPLRRRVAPRALLAVCILALAVVGGISARVVLSDAGDPVAGPSGASEVGPTASRASSASTASAPPILVAGGSAAASGAALVVDVVGRVRHPGIVHLPLGSRVADAVLAAGGPVAGAAVSRVNLARKLVDGEQVVVPGPGDPLTAAGSEPGSGGTGPGSTQLIELNSATAAQLDALPGVGVVTAQRIIAWRTQHQRFSRVEELGEVPGIGPKLLQRLTPLVRVS